MSLKRLQLARNLYHSSQIQPQYSSHLLGSCRNYSNVLSNASDFANVKTLTFRSTMAAEFSIFMNDRKMSTSAVKVRPNAQVRPMGAQICLSSPGIIYEPYEPREKIPFWKRMFTRSGWERTKSDLMMEVKNAYTIARLRKTGYSKKQFYLEAISMYKEINTLIANGDKHSLRKAVTEKMFSTLKNEIKVRETTWSKVYWEMVEPVVLIRTLRARMLGVDKSDTNKVFYQITLEILAKHKFEAYDSKGSVVAGDKNKEVLVRDIWIFEKASFLPRSYWRLCGRISPKAS